MRSPDFSRCRSLVFVALGLALALAGTASAQSIRDQLMALSDGLNDPDPIIRIVTYEEAVKSENATIRRVALRTALQSNDADLRSLALRGAFAGRETVVFKLAPSEAYAAALEAAGDNEKKRQAATKQFRYHQQLGAAYSWTLPLHIEEYDYDKGTIAGACMTKMSSPEDRWKFSGTIAGDEIALTLSCYTGGYSACNLAAELGEGGTLEGRLSCANNSRAKATLDLL